MMDENRFWNLIEQSRDGMTPALSDQPYILQDLLEKLPPVEIVGFQRIHTRLFFMAYRKELWAAAYIVGEGGCSDDSFMDFRYGLIALGKEAFYEALRDPNTLARQPATGVDFFFESMGYAARKAYEAVVGEDMPEDPTSEFPELTGEDWDPDTVHLRYPEIAEKFGYVA